MNTITSVYWRRTFKNFLMTLGSIFGSRCSLCGETALSVVSCSVSFVTLNGRGHRVVKSSSSHLLSSSSRQVSSWGSSRWWPIGHRLMANWSSLFLSIEYPTFASIFCEKSCRNPFECKTRLEIHCCCRSEILISN